MAYMSRKNFINHRVNPSVINFSPLNNYDIMLLLSKLNGKDGCMDLIKYIIDNIKLCKDGIINFLDLPCNAKSNKVFIAINNLIYNDIIYKTEITNYYFINYNIFYYKGVENDINKIKKFYANVNLILDDDKGERDNLSEDLTLDEVLHDGTYDDGYSDSEKVYIDNTTNEIRYLIKIDEIDINNIDSDMAIGSSDNSFNINLKSDVKNDIIGDVVYSDEVKFEDNIDSNELLNWNKEYKRYLSTNIFKNGEINNEDVKNEDVNNEDVKNEDVKNDIDDFFNLFKN